MPYQNIPRKLRQIILALSIALLTSTATYAEQKPVTFSANVVTNNAETGILTASGNVVFEQDALKLTADQVQYNQNDGTATATGNVIFIDRNGNTHYTETLKLNDNFARAFAQPVITNLKDGSWLGADNISRTSDGNITFSKSEFTPCKCNYREGEIPIWDINTSKTQHDTKTKTLHHHNVTMHILNVPIMYFPYISHPDGTVRRRSGIMPPEIRFSSDFGLVYGQSYYWVTGKTHDLEVKPYIFGDKGEVAQTTFRQRWEQTNLDARLIGGRLNSYKQTKENVAAIDLTFDTNIAQQWKTKIKIKRTSQDTFLRRYKFDDDKELTTSLTTEKITPTQYNKIEAYDIQDLRSGRGPETEPTVLPQIFHEQYLHYQQNQSIRLRLSAIQLDNDESTDLKRWSSEIYALRDVTTNAGIITLEARAAAQYRDIETAPNKQGYTGELGQGVAAIGIGWAQPISFNTAGRLAIFEPKAKLSATKATDRTDKVPNRDSADFRLDEANLFLLHREQGEDYNITNTRADVGASLYLYDQYLGDVTGFVGSSIRISGQTPTGLNAATDRDRYADVIASLEIKPSPSYSIAMSGRFHPRDLYLNESTVKGSAKFGKTEISATYEQLANSYFDSADQEKEELTLKAKQNLGNDWDFSFEQVYDLTDDTRKLSDSSVALNYDSGIQDCLTIKLAYNRDTEHDRDIRPVDEVFLIFSFKYLGDVSTADLGSK